MTFINDTFSFYRYIIRFLYFLFPCSQGSRKEYFFNIFRPQHSVLLHKHKLGKKVIETVKSFTLCVADQVDVFTLTLKDLTLPDQFKFVRKPTRQGHSLFTKCDLFSSL